MKNETLKKMSYLHVPTISLLSVLAPGSRSPRFPASGLGGFC